MSTNLQSGGNGVSLVQCMPEMIRLYAVQEAELMVISKGADTLPLQVSLALGGAFVGALPNAFTAVQQWRSFSAPLELSSMVSLMLACSSLLGCAVCALLHRNQKTYPDLLLREILNRKNSQVT